MSELFLWTEGSHRSKWNLMMTSSRFGKVVRFHFLLWITRILLIQNSNDHGVNASTSISPEYWYLFYQQPEYPRDCQEVQEQCLHITSSSSSVHFIKPEGYPIPFEVNCDNSAGSRGWTVLLRRTNNGSTNFNRTWEDYKQGFGYLAHEFWIGSERLSYLTNQMNYQLLIEMILSDGSSVNVSHDNFRIGDEFSNYQLISLDQYNVSTDAIYWCPDNMVYGSCTCGQRRCGDPATCQDTCPDGLSESCICPEGFYMSGEDCVPKEQCGCYIPEDREIVPEGEQFVNAGCTSMAACSNGNLTWNETYECSPNAVCESRNGARRCHCNQGYSGDGETCTAPHTDCMDIYNYVSRASGVYTIKPTNWPGLPFSVYCNMTDGGGWTVFQRRVDGSVDFYLDWASYKEGFGSLSHEHWLGNEKLYYMTNQGTRQLRVDVVGRDGAPYYAKFTSFRISNEADKYRLSDVGTYSGTAHRTRGGYALLEHRGYPFSTKDRDHDSVGSNCAVNCHGAWWYIDCYDSNLNGDYHASMNSWSSLVWFYLPTADQYGRNLKFSEMKIRPA